MDYCLGAGDGTASMWSAQPDVDTDGDGVLDAVGVDLDDDGLRDDALLDLDGDGLADHAALDFAAEPAWFTDDGSGTWALAAAAPGSGSALRWYSLDGVEQSGGPLVDFDADGAADDRLFDSDGDGVADRAIAEDGSIGFVDLDGDGRMDLKLVDADGDGAAEDAGAL